MNSILSLFKEDVQHLLKHSWKQVIGLGFLVGGLLFLLNIFLGVSFFAHGIGDTIKDKLGMYFYINETSGDQSAVYGRVTQLQKDLQVQGLSVSFSSKDDAMKFLAQKVPEVVSNLEKFGIKNPLPSTLYVMFHSSNEYESLKSTITNYKDIILNNKDMETSNLQDQEMRILHIFSLTSAITWLSIFIVILMLVVIFSFLGYLFTTVFDHFKKHFEIKKLLGASLWEMIQDFRAVNSFVISIGFVVCI
jgi:cell division protein FtsX